MFTADLLLLGGIYTYGCLLIYDYSKQTYGGEDELGAELRASVARELLQDGPLDISRHGCVCFKTDNRTTAGQSRANARWQELVQDRISTQVCHHM